MTRKTIEFEGEFKVKLKFTMTSGEEVTNETIEQVTKLMHNNMAEEIENSISYWFYEDEEGVDNFEVTCEKIDTTTNVINNTSEPTSISEDIGRYKNKCGEE